MRSWFVFGSMACSLALVNVSLAQNDVPQAKPAVQVQQIQIQVQAQPAIQIQPAVADRVAMPGIAYMPGPRLAQADAVFTGRVVALEPMDVVAQQVANGPKVTYRIAVIEVSEAIFGLKKDTKQVRVGFVMQGNVPQPGIVPPGGGVQILPAQPQPAIQPLPPNFGPRRPFPGNFQMNLTVGQDGLFTVNKHHKEAFYLSPNVQNFVSRENNPGFEGQVKTAKQLGKVMGDPVASLKAEDRADRYTAAAVLITKYRTASNPNGQPMKLQPIDAGESKLILKALAEGDWKQGAFNAAIPAPFELFNQLGLNQKDGYNPVNIRTQQELFTAMQKWLDENNGKYVIQKYVVDPNAKVPVIQPGGDPKPGIDVPIRPLPPVKIRPGIQPLPAPVPQPAPIEIELPVRPAVEPLPPAKRE